MMRERFVRTIFTNGRVGLALRTPRDIQEESAGHDLLPDGQNLDKAEVTALLLHMLAEAYHAGYKEAVADGAEAVQRLLYESSAQRKPAPRISESTDYRDMHQRGKTK